MSVDIHKIVCYIHWQKNAAYCYKNQLRLINAIFDNRSDQPHYHTSVFTAFFLFLHKPESVSADQPYSALDIHIKLFD